MKKTLWNFGARAQFTRRGGIGRGPVSENFFQGSIYKVAGGDYFTTFLKKILKNENLICDGKLFELNKDMREV